MATPVRLRKFVMALLFDLSPEAVLVGLRRTLDGTGYLVRIEIPGVIGKSWELPRELIEAAPTNPRARERLRTILRSALHVARGHRAVSHSLQILGRTPSLPSCRVCAEPLPLDEHVVFEAGGLRHARCARTPTVTPRRPRRKPARLVRRAS